MASAPGEIMDSLLERDLLIVEQSKSLSNTKISRLHGVSRERVRQILLEYGIRNDRRTEPSERVIENLELAGKVPDKFITQITGASQATISAVKKRYGKKKYIKPIGCAKCKTHTYARGLCKNCWHRADYHGTLYLYPRVRKQHVR